MALLSVNITDGSCPRWPAQQWVQPSVRRYAVESEEDVEHGRCWLTHMDRNAQMRKRKLIQREQGFDKGFVGESGPKTQNVTTAVTREISIRSPAQIWACRNMKMREFHVLSKMMIWMNLKLPRWTLKTMSSMTLVTGLMMKRLSTSWLFLSANMNLHWTMLSCNDWTPWQTHWKSCVWQRWQSWLMPQHCPQMPSSCLPSLLGLGTKRWTRMDSRFGWLLDFVSLSCKSCEMLQHEVATQIMEKPGDEVSLLKRRMALQHDHRSDYLVTLLLNCEALTCVICMN